MPTSKDTVGEGDRDTLVGTGKLPVPVAVLVWHPNRPNTMVARIVVNTALNSRRPAFTIHLPRPDSHPWGELTFLGIFQSRCRQAFSAIAPPKSDMGGMQIDGVDDEGTELLYY